MTIISLKHRFKPKGASEMLCIPLADAAQQNPNLAWELSKEEGLELQVSIAQQDGSQLIIESCLDSLIFAIAADYKPPFIFERVIRNQERGKYLFWKRPGTLYLTPNGDQLHLELRGYYRSPRENHLGSQTEISVDKKQFFSETIRLAKELIKLYSVAGVDKGMLIPILERHQLELEEK